MSRLEAEFPLADLPALVPVARALAAAGARLRLGDRPDRAGLLPDSWVSAAVLLPGPERRCLGRLDWEGEPLGDPRLLLARPWCWPWGAWVPYGLVVGPALPPANGLRWLRVDGGTVHWEGRSAIWQPTQAERWTLLARASLILAPDGPLARDAGRAGVAWQPLPGLAWPTGCTIPAGCAADPWFWAHHPLPSLAAPARLLEEWRTKATPAGDQAGRWTRRVRRLLHDPRRFLRPLLDPTRHRWP